MFPKLRARSPLSHDVLDQLDGDHVSYEKRIRDLEHALLELETMGAPRRLALENAAESYLRFYLAHMATEEQRILPSTESMLTEKDWAELDCAFSANR